MNPNLEFIEDFIDQEIGNGSAITMPPSDTIKKPLVKIGLFINEKYEEEYFESKVKKDFV